MSLLSERSWVTIPTLCYWITQRMWLLCPDMTEKLLTWMLSYNQIKYLSVTERDNLSAGRGGPPQEIVDQIRCFYLSYMLQKEITSLRGEVAHLKKLLIAHKDCPVTIQQKSTGQILTQQPGKTIICRALFLLADVYTGQIKLGIKLLTRNFYKISNCWWNETFLSSR